MVVFLVYNIVTINNLPFLVKVASSWSSSWCTKSKNNTRNYVNIEVLRARVAAACVVWNVLTSIIHKSFSIFKTMTHRPLKLACFPIADNHIELRIAFCVGSLHCPVIFSKSLKERITMVFITYKLAIC